VVIFETGKDWFKFRGIYKELHSKTLNEYQNSLRNYPISMKELSSFDEPYEQGICSTRKIIHGFP